MVILQTIPITTSIFSKGVGLMLKRGDKTETTHVDLPRGDMTLAGLAETLSSRFSGQGLEARVEGHEAVLTLPDGTRAVTVREDDVQYHIDAYGKLAGEDFTDLEGKLGGPDPAYQELFGSEEAVEETYERFRRTMPEDNPHMQVVDGLLEDADVETKALFLYAARHEHIDTREALNPSGTPEEFEVLNEYVQSLDDHNYRWMIGAGKKLVEGEGHHTNPIVFRASLLYENSDDPTYGLDDVMNNIMGNEMIRKKLPDVATQQYEPTAGAYQKSRAA